MKKTLYLKKYQELNIKYFNYKKTKLIDKNFLKQIAKNYKYLKVKF